MAIPQTRDELYQFLLKLPDAQFNQVLFSLNPPPSLAGPPRETPGTGGRAIAIGQSVEGANVVAGDNNRITLFPTVNYYYGPQPAPTRTDRNEITVDG